MNVGHLWIYAFIPQDLQVTGSPISQRPHLPQGGPHAAGTVHDTRHRRQGCLVPLDGTLLPYNTTTNIQLYISLNIPLWFPHCFANLNHIQVAQLIEHLILNSGAGSLIPTQVIWPLN